MKKFVIQIILLLTVIGAGIFLFNPSTGKTPEIPFLPQPPKTAQLQINGNSIKVEVADTAQKRSKGLAGKSELSENEGMLFVFDRLDKYVFWMKGLSFPLDFVWIKDTQVVDILENIPPPSPGQSDDSLPVYSSKVDFNKVLEIKAGTVKRLNIKAGDTINLI